MGKAMHVVPATMAAVLPGGGSRSGQGGFGPPALASVFFIAPLFFSSFSLSSCLFLFLYFPENQFEERDRVKNESARNPGLSPGARTLVPLLPNPLEPSWPPDSRLQFP